MGGRLPEGNGEYELEDGGSGDAVPSEDGPAAEIIRGAVPLITHSIYRSLYHHLQIQITMLIPVCGYLKREIGNARPYSPMR